MGFAGGRVDRIARAAGCSVRMIYAYFGHKSGLFDSCFRHAITTMNAEIPPRPDDLADWASDLVSYHHTNPQPLRISMWAQLERPEPAEEALGEFVEKASAVTPAAIAPFTGPDLLVLIYAIAQSWQLSPAGLTTIARSPGDASELARRQRAARAAVQKLLAPSPATTSSAES
ncbi:TetR family transcriptional regulator [Microbacterium albipurpureum]|uniref:TetR family transcriptional regulator n=1 Tax=Microbacterium albipurpureum TaxID=3050384 RepID=UPI003BF56ECA